MSKKKEHWWYRATEKLLYTYKGFPIKIKGLKQQLEIIQEQMMPSIVPSYDLKEGTNYGVSSPVETAVINRLESDKVKKIEQKIKNLETLKEIVEDSIDRMLDSDQKRLVILQYDQKRSWLQITHEMSISKNTYYDMKDEIVKILAWCFNYLPDEAVEETLGLFTDLILWEKSGNKTGINRE